MTPRWRGGWADRLELLGPLGVYAFVTLAGLTTSSVGLLSTAGTGGVAGQIGTPLRVRSDEWLTQAPIELAVLANGSSMHPPLSQAPDLIFQVSSGGPFESVLFLEGNLLRLGALLPDTMLFAAFRAFPWLLVALFLPPLLRRLGANRPLSWLAVVLCFLAPASLWWSFMPIRILGFAAAGCYLLFVARDRLGRTPPDRRSRVLGLLQAALAGILLARLVSYYVPWSVTIGVPLVLATGVFLVREKELRRPALLAVGAGALVSLVVLGGTFWENAAALTAELDTVYPGLRRTTGAALTPYQLFGAPGLFGLADFPAPAVLNQSEISSAFLICAVWAAVLWGRARGTATPPQRAALLTLAIATTVVASWAMVSWGGLGSHLPLLSAVMPERAAQTAGFPATLLLCLVASRLEGDTRKLALAAALVTGAVTAYAVSDLQKAIPELVGWQVWLVVLLTAVLVWAVTRFPRHWAPVVAVLVVTGLAGLDSNPLLFGLGEIRDSPAARSAMRFQDRSEDEHVLFAADNWFTTAMLVANGVPSMTGYQVTGPDRDAWERIDPDGTAEEVWNRGSSYLLMTFDGPRDAPPVVAQGSSPDVIAVQADPCWLADSDFAVTHIVTSGAKAPRCGTLVDEFTWSGLTQYVYRLTPSS